MDQEGQYKISQALQKTLLHSASNSNSTSVNNEQKSKLITDLKTKEVSERTEYLNTEVYDVDPEEFDKWVPYLRQSVENEQLPSLLDDLYNSVDENFEGLESTIIQDSHISEKLKSSMNEISNVQNLINKNLTVQIQDIQSQLSKSTKDTIVKKQVFVNNKKSSAKISETSILITKVLKILQLSNKCQDLIEQKNFFKALQNLDSLEKIYLQEFKSYEFEILKNIYDTIPISKLYIKNESLNIIRNSFNSNLGNNIKFVGEKVFMVYKDQLLSQWIKTKKDMTLANFMFNSPVEISLRDQDTLTQLELDKFYDLFEFQDAILIFESLNETDLFFDEFSKEYNFRKNTIIHPIIWKKSHSSSSNSIPGDILNDMFTQKMSMLFLKEYFLKILGFLLYDINLNKSTNFVLVNNNYSATNEFWIGLMNRLNPYLKYYVQNIIKSENELKEFKEFFFIYIAILENFKLSIDSLYSLLMSVFRTQCTFAIESFAKDFVNLLNDDDFMPLVINDKNLFEKIKRICWMKDEDEHLDDNSIDEEGNFVVIFPFSPLYPMTCTLLRKTYSKLIAFVDNAYRHELHMISNILVRTIDTILNDTVNKQIITKLNTTSREEIAQILINLDYFVIAAVKLSNMMTTDNILQNPDVEIKLSAIKNFTTTREVAEDELIELIDNKLNDILETVTIDWETTEVRNDPDFSIVDIAQFLEMMFASTLVNLPYSVQTLLIFREFDSLSSQFLNMLLYETSNKISEASVLNFEMDIQYLKSVIPRVFPGANDLNNEEDRSRIQNNIKSLESTFTELDQCISLLKSNNPLDFEDPHLRLQKYPRVREDYATILVHKVQRVEDEAVGPLDPASLKIQEDNASGFDLMSNADAITKFFKK